MRPILQSVRLMNRKAAFAVVGLVLLLAGCGQESGSSDSDLGWRVSRVKDGFFGGTLEENMARNGVPGVSTAVINNHDIEWAKGFGVATAHGNKPVTPDTLFKASSISKAVTAALALNLVEKGLLKIDENINERLVSWRVPQNQFTARAPVTLRQLLNHTAGVNRPEGGFSYEKEYPSTLQILKGERPATNKPADIECMPGTELRYSNFGYVIVQLLVEDVTRRPFAEVARDIVLSPIGMTSSTFEQPLAKGMEERASFPHDAAGAPMERFYNPNAVGQGGLWTTPSDLARFLIEIMRSRTGNSNRVLSQKMTVQMLTPHYRELDGGVFWGLGFMLLGDWGLVQAGSDPGFRCLMVGFPKLGKGIVVMVNGDGGELLQLRLALNFIIQYLVVPSKWSFTAGGCSFLLLLSALIIWPAGFLRGLWHRRRLGSKKPDPVPRMRGRRQRLVAALAAAANLGTIYPYVLCSFSSQGPPAWNGGSLLAKAILGLIVICGLLSLFAVIFAIRAWKDRFWTPASRVYYSCVTLAAVTGSLLWLALLDLI